MNSFSEATLAEYLKQLSSRAPAPGGGSASAIVAALALGLLEKVAVISQEKEKEPSFEPEISRCRSLRKEAMDLSDRDARAYTRVVRAYQARASSDEEKAARRRAIDEALKESFEAAFQLLELAVTGEQLREGLLKKTKGSIASDLEVALGFFKAARAGAHHLAQVNLECVKDAPLKAELLSKLSKVQ